MKQIVRFKTRLTCTVVVSVLIAVVGYVVSCDTVPTAVVVQGLVSTGNAAPSLEIIEPVQSFTKGRGEPFVIRWTDTDQDSNASIRFDLIDTRTGDVVTKLVENIPENDDVGPDEISVPTALLPLGTFNIRGTIDDGINAPVSVFSVTGTGAAAQRVVMLIVEPGQGPPSNPPTVAVIEPSFNLSIAQDDELRIVVQPGLLAPDAANPFDLDSDITLFILLDTDLDPNNDDPSNPDPDEIIVLQQQRVVAGSSEPIVFEIPIDLSVIPPRPGGDPYFIRATADDSSNPRVHQYAVGRINVVELASGFVDLFDIGKTKSGTRFYGFSPGANVGSTVSRVGDFDVDGVDDFMLVARFGNPRNYGLLGEAYLVYGQNDLRFGGSLAVNTISETISGVIFEAPPMRTRVIPGDARTDGITSAAFVADLTGDGRPELLLGLPHVHGAFDTMDYDPGDDDVTSTENTEDVTVSIRQGQTVITVEGAAPETDFLYSGVDDLAISSSAQNTSFGSDREISWEDNGQEQRRWGLLKFKDVLDVIPDSLQDIRISSVQATLTVRVFNTGGDGVVHRAFTDFDERTTFSDFAQNGGAPEPDVDYDGEAGGIGAIDGGSGETVELDVTDIVRELIDGLLQDSVDNELRFIIVPDPEAGNDLTAIRSSEYGLDADRPTLEINYTRINVFGELGCYRDRLVNNMTDDTRADQFDTQYYAGGMAVMVSSENRDIFPVLNPRPDRLDTTVVSIELVGQRSGFFLGRLEMDETGSGDIFVRADSEAEEGRIAGMRFIAGGYDDVDASRLRQGPRDGLFGQSVASIGDLNNDGSDEIIISAPRNERYLQDLFDSFREQSTHLNSTVFPGSITIVPGNNYNDSFWRDQSGEEGTAIIPFLDHQHHATPGGSCPGGVPRHLDLPPDAFNIFAEHVDDFLGDGQSAGDFNQDGLDDILCGAPLNDRNSSLRDTGATYIIYGRNVLGDFNLSNADDLLRRPPMMRIRGLKAGDRIGWSQSTGLDVDGDRVDDVFIGSPSADFGGVLRATCAGDFNRDGTIDATDLSFSAFAGCRDSVGQEVFTDDACKIFDYDNNREIDEDDEAVFRCLENGGTNCCDTVVDNGFVGIIFGGVFTDGDRTIDQIATSDLPGAIFYGAASGHRAGHAISSAGDFNQDGFGDILIVAPGERRLDTAGRQRLGVVYLVFGGTHLKNTRWSLSQVGTRDLPGMIFLSPYTDGRPNEAPPEAVAFIGDINNDGFGDIAIGNPSADFIDLSFPQGPEATDSQLGRRRDAGDVYIIYGNNFGSNRIGS